MREQNDPTGAQGEGEVGEQGFGEGVTGGRGGEDEDKYMSGQSVRPGM